MSSNTEGSCSSSKTTSTSSTATTTTAITSNTLYKGKSTTRSWNQLPPEIVRLIATHYLLDISSHNFSPQIWDLRENLYSRIVYTILRDAHDIEKIMRICPSWHIALETHLFWHQACSVIDPLESLAHHVIVRPHPATNTTPSTLPSLPFRLTPYRHFRNITNCSCFVCRINSPHNNMGLAIAKRTFPTPYVGTIFVCRDHRKSTFCGICLRESPPLESETDYNLVSCIENEDDETWPGVDTTCRACRSEWLWRRVSPYPKDREAVGGPNWTSPDWETRQTIDAFIEMGEGTISDVVTLAREKRWLHNHTKLPDMLSQALAASRFASREDGLGGAAGYASEEELSDDDVDEEEDPELLSLTEDAGGVRDLAISDWARNRILDGHWYSPADQWHGNVVPNHSTVVRAVHPCPWNRDSTYTGAVTEEERDLDVDSDGEVAHPRPATVRAEVPPTSQLCEQVCIAFQKQMRMILLPAMANIIRRIVMESEADFTDPVKRAAQMEMEDIIAELRDDAVWHNGIDWLERRANRRRELLERRRRAADRKEKEKDGSDDSSASSRSDESHTTSPVWSTSTLRTTPSPPPCDENKDGEAALPGGAGRIARILIPPVLESPVLIHPIPYVPVSVSHLPYYSMESLKMVWREACTPIYHCRCKICERSVSRATSRNVAIKQVEVPSQNVVAVPKPEKPVEVTINEALPADIEGEEEVVEEESEEEESEEGHTTLDKLDSVTVALKRSLENLDVVTSKKRGSSDLDEGDAADFDHTNSSGGTPPKKARTDGDGLTTARSKPPSPQRLKKRGSEELEDGEGVGKKRLKVNQAGDGAGVEESPPTSLTVTDSMPSSESPDEQPEDGRLEVMSIGPGPRPLCEHPRSLSINPPPTRALSETASVRDADLDQLYTLKGEVDAG